MGPDTDVLVVGAGLSGLLAAIALARPEPGAGRRVTLADAGTVGRDTPDGRATALAPSSTRMLARLGIALPEAAPLTGMRVGEGEADSPWQFELPSRPDEPLAHVVENAALRRACLAALDTLDVKRVEGVRLTGLERSGHVRARFDDGRTVDAALVVAADGRDSAVRRLSGLSVSRHDFRQKALVTTVTHAEDHEGTALQRFQSVGAVASLPLPDAGRTHRSQIVWSDRTAAVDAACALPASALAALIDDRLWGALEVTGIAAPVQSYPLTGQRAEALSAERVALVGDAARIIHPLAGQGFNLAVRDVAALVQSVGEAAATGQDVGTAGLIGYARWRRVDETLLGAVTAGLSAVPSRLGRLGRLVGHARRAVFATVDEWPALHPFIRAEASGDTGERPHLLN